MNSPLQNGMRHPYSSSSSSEHAPGTEEGHEGERARQRREGRAEECGGEQVGWKGKRGAKDRMTKTAERRGGGDRAEGREKGSWNSQIIGTSLVPNCAER